jgi:hypothetical protein
MDNLLKKFNELTAGEQGLITQFIKAQLARGEDLSVVAGHVRRSLSVVAKNNDVAGEGGRPLEDQRDPAEELEDLTDAYVEAHKVKRSKAYNAVLCARPDLNAALANQRDVKLRKAAQAFGDGYGVYR